MSAVTGAPDRAAGWARDAAGTAYPPEPWFLGGDFAVAVHLVALRDLPAEVWGQVPRGARPLTIAGRAIVGVAAVHYTPGGVLAYDELLVALPVLYRGRLAVTIPQIWVTSAASRAGGRALWGIPKELMTAEREVTGATLHAEFREEAGDGLASVRARAGRALPGKWILPLPTVQRGEVVVITSRNTVIGRIRAARIAMTVNGPLAWLSGRRPLLTLAITRAQVAFGERVAR